jgi:hypothetical protein
MTREDGSCVLYIGAKVRPFAPALLLGVISFTAKFEYHTKSCWAEMSTAFCCSKEVISRNSL